MYVLILLLIALPALGQSLDPGTIGRAGTHDLSGKSGSALLWNPAVLAQTKSFKASWELPSFMASVANNAFSVGYWNNEMASDTFFDEAEKRDILDHIPDSGWRTNLQASVPAFGFTYNRFAVNATVEAAGCLTAPRDIIRLALLGNELDRDFALGNGANDAQVYGDYSAGFGYKLDQEKIPELLFGIGFHFYHGLALAKVVRSDVNFLTTNSAMHTSGVIQTVTSTAGDGVGFDLGGMATLSDEWQVGLAFRQLGARMTWQVEENRQITFYTDSAGVNMENQQLGSSDFVDSVLHKEDYEYPGGSVETKLSPVVQMNGRYLPHPKWTILGDASVRLRESVKGPSGLDVSVAGEYRALPWLALQSGFGLGNLWGPRFGLGAGLRFNHYELDGGWGWNGGLFNGARGVAFGLTQRIYF